MPKRRGTQKINSEQVQGDASWVEIDSLTVKEVKEMRKLASQDDYDNFDAGITIIKNHVLNWNWVDYDNTPLPTPQDSPDIVDSLTVDEVNFLASALMGETDEAKN